MHQSKAAFSGPYMRLYDGARPELNMENFKFQGPDRFNGSFR
jgi:hypothetical protein